MSKVVATVSGTAALLLFIIGVTNRTDGLLGAAGAVQAAWQQFALVLGAALLIVFSLLAMILFVVRHSGDADVSSGGDFDSSSTGLVRKRSVRFLAPRAFSILLIVGGALGLLAAFELSIDKIAILQDPTFVPSCNISPFLTCSRNLKSSQGSIFGFPNPLIGLVMFPAPIVVGLASLLGVAFPRWFWAAFNLGIAFAIGFVMWLISVSLFTLGTLCPWCMVVWASVIPMSIATTLFNIRNQALPLGPMASRIAAVAFTWTPTITLIAYVLFAAAAQVRLDVLNRI